MSSSKDAVKAIRFDPNAQGDGRSPTTTTQWYSDPAGRFKSGFWASDISRSEVNYVKDEICFILEGVVRLTDETGHEETYRSGDAFIVPTGFKGIWENVEPVRKFYAIHDPAKN
jgi:uncharacterized cupin superfamily protein